MKSESLLRSAAIYTLANLGNSAIPFLMLPLLTRVLSPSDFGTVVVFTTTITVLGAFTGLSVHGAVNVKFHDRSVDIGRYTGTALCILAASGSGVVLLVLLIGGWLSGVTGLSRGWLVLAALASASQFLIQIRLGLWQAQSKAISFGLLQVGQTALNLALSVLLVIPADWGWQGRAAGVSVAAIVAAAAALVLLWRGREATWPPTRAYARDALRFGVPLIPHVVGAVALANSDRMLVAAVSGLHEAGVYAASMQLGLLVSVVADAVVKAATPHLYRSIGTADDAERVRIVRLTYAYFAFMLLVAAGAAAAAPWLMKLVGGAFRGDGDVLAFVALGSAFGGMYLMVVSYIFYASRNEWLSLLTLSVGTANVGLTWWLVRWHGAVGAAQAFALAQFVMFVCTWALAARCHPMPWQRALGGLFQPRSR